MRFQDEVVEDALTRLRRVQGQVGGIIRMIEDGRECREVIQQISAAGRGLERVGLRLLASRLRECVAGGGSPAEVAEAEAEVERLLTRLR